MTSRGSERAAQRGVGAPPQPCTADSRTGSDQVREARPPPRRIESSSRRGRYSSRPCRFAPPFPASSMGLGASAFQSLDGHGARGVRRPPSRLGEATWRLLAYRRWEPPPGCFWLRRGIARALQFWSAAMNALARTVSALASLWI